LIVNFKAEVLITTPFHPGYLTAEIMEKAKNLKLCITAGVGSDHIDLNAAVKHGVEVLEVSGSNVVSVAEHVVMSILLLVRNFVPAHEVRYHIRPVTGSAGTDKLFGCL
jgi:formate dehydrogenase